MPRPVDSAEALSQGAFVHTFLPGRVVFGAGSLERVADEAAALGVRRALIVATNSARDAADAVEAQLKDRFAGRIDGVAQHVPTEVAENARTKAGVAEADAIIAIGGGSAVGLAKAIARTHTRRPGGLAIVAVPTTYAGSEMTPVWGETSGGSKSTGTDLKVLPRVVVYDPVLSQHLPITVTAASVANAIAHCVEAVWTPKADPITDIVAVEGLRALSAGLRAVLAESEDLDARGKLLYGACLAGSALATAGTGLHHKLCHLLGGTYGLPHAETHAAVLPQVTRINAPAVPESAARLSAALGGSTDAVGLARQLFDLFDGAGVAVKLRELGLTEEQADAAAAGFDVTGNPVVVGEDEIREILRRALDGVRP